mmetsp:Transcript_16837/g.35341  ORF Transcript_16837/g.35341 Transcript_16837/m.35341 type:complete len:151 (+) Transcript_16837:170-622(+)
MTERDLVIFHETNNTEISWHSISVDRNQDVERFQSQNFSSHHFYSILRGQASDRGEIYHDSTADIMFSFDSISSAGNNADKVDNNHNKALVHRLLTGHSLANPQDAVEDFSECIDDDEDDDTVHEYLNSFIDELDLYRQKGCSFVTRSED